MRSVFVTGGTGYLGRRLISELLARGHLVRALVRDGSQQRLPLGAESVIGNALDASSYASRVPHCDTFVQLVGVPHPSPAKARQFREIDYPAGMAGVQAAVLARLNHFVYVSVAHPARMMKAYIQVRSEVEAEIRKSGLAATILRPWYILGPGHRWPILLKPIYWLLEALPGTRDSARRLGLVTLAQMVKALVFSVEHPPSGVRILEVPQIRSQLSLSDEA